MKNQVPLREVCQVSGELNCFLSGQNNVFVWFTVVHSHYYVYPFFNVIWEHVDSKSLALKMTCQISCCVLLSIITDYLPIFIQPLSKKTWPLPNFLGFLGPLKARVFHSINFNPNGLLPLPISYWFSKQYFFSILNFLDDVLYGWMAHQWWLWPQ